MDDHATPTSRDVLAGMIQADAFPCVGAKSALARDALQVFEAGSLLDAGSDADVLATIQAFAASVPADALFASLAIAYPDTPQLDEAAFETALWSRLQALHELDRRRFDWDASVSSDPDDDRFSMSLGGRAFYVIGLHAGASRPARRIDGAMLVFNLHSQFEVLRADGRYQKLSATIRERDEAFAGSVNPMLARHGEASEARQYSGRVVGDDWRCPFHAHAGRAA